MSVEYVKQDVVSKGASANSASGLSAELISVNQNHGVKAIRKIDSHCILFTMYG